jgi:Na+-transporting NADH:ubiquinone oxidoreductase subunit NqrB
VFDYLRRLATGAWQRQDPRLYQIAVLAGLFGYGVVWLDFAVPGVQAAVVLVTVLLTQAVCGWLWRLPTYDPRSALISGLSLCLLLRTNALSVAVLTAVLTIVSKFVLGWHGKHLFNPTNIGLVAMMLATGQIWVSPGQWGSAAFFAFLLAACGGLVVYRATRSDVTYAFLGCHVALRLGRALWLGDPLSIPLHQLQNGALVLFAFFMISDPKTTPDTRCGRIVFAGLVALGAWYLQFVWYWSNALLWSLACCALTVPLLDWLFQGQRYAWPLTDNAVTPAAPACASPVPSPSGRG